MVSEDCCTYCKKEEITESEMELINLIQYIGFKLGLTHMERHISFSTREDAFNYIKSLHSEITERIEENKK